MKALVLLSGGLDSTAALIWRCQQPGDVAAVFIYYGQPAASRECERAIATARALGVPFHRLDLATAFYGGSRRGLFTPQPSGYEHGVDTAFVPLRNPLLLSAAAARALMLWPLQRDRPLSGILEPHVELVVGFNQDDVQGFPDCRAIFVGAFEHALNLGLGHSGAIRVVVPWATMPKREVIRYVRECSPEHMPLIDASWSCYREQGPCGECTACVARARAMVPEGDSLSDRGGEPNDRVVRVRDEDRADDTAPLGSA